MMYLIHESTIKNTDGVIDISVIVVSKLTGGYKKMKRYTYNVSSEFAARQFHSLYKKGRKLHGKALNVLNQFKLKGDAQ